jgi:hypothetical protein
MGYQAFLRIGAVFAISPILYVAIGELIRQVLQPFEGFATADLAIPNGLRYILLGLAAADLALIWYLQGPHSPLTIPEEGNPKILTQRLKAMSILFCVLCEGAGVFGLVLFLIDGSSIDLYGFNVLSLLLFALFFPRYRQWEEWSQRAAARLEP